MMQILCVVAIIIFLRKKLFEIVKLNPTDSGTGRSALEGGVVTGPHLPIHDLTDSIEPEFTPPQEQQQQEQIQQASNELHELEQRINALHGMLRQQHAPRH